MYKYEEIRAVHLELTERCQAACPLCHRFIKEDVLNPNLTMAELSLKDIKFIFPVDFIRQLNSIRISGQNGEPIIAKDCLEIVQYFKESNPNIFIEISTNAGARSSDWWTKLAKVLSKTDVVWFCIDGLEDTNHIYRKKIKWNAVMNSAKTFISAGGNAVWDFLIFEHNEHQVDDAKELAKQLGFKDIRFKASMRFVSFDNSNETIKPPKNKKYLHEAFLFASNTSNIKQFNAIDKPNDPKTREENLKKTIIEKTIIAHNKFYIFVVEKTKLIDCKALKRKEIYISAEGLLSPCSFISGTSKQPYDTIDKKEIRDIIVDKEFINIKKHSINSILNTGIFDEIKDTWNVPSCLKTCKKKCSDVLSNKSNNDTNIDANILNV